ncbi:hypothetical protein F5883DRAFT_579239, partial [Diaporthe sp. PMI_573]
MDKRGRGRCVWMNVGLADCGHALEVLLLLPVCRCGAQLALVGVELKSSMQCGFVPGRVLAAGFTNALAPWRR